MLSKHRLHGEVDKNHGEGRGGLKAGASGKKIKEVYTESHTAGLRNWEQERRGCPGWGTGQRLRPVSKASGIGLYQVSTGEKGWREVGGAFQNSFLRAVSGNNPQRKP